MFLVVLLINSMLVLREAMRADPHLGVTRDRPFGGTNGRPKTTADAKKLGVMAHGFCISATV